MNLMFLTKVEEDYTLRHSGVIGKAVNTGKIKYRRTFFIWNSITLESLFNIAVIMNKLPL